MIKVDALNKQIKQHQAGSLYLVLGTEDHLINQVVSAFHGVLRPEERSMNFAQYDLTNDSLGSAIDDASSVPFFGDHRLVFLTRPFFAMSENIKATVEQDVSILERYLKKPTPSTILVIFAHTHKLDGRKKIAKLLMKHAQVVDVQKIEARQVESTLDNYLSQHGFQINAEARTLLLQRSDGDFSNIIDNLEKLFITASDKQITLPMVEDLVAPTLENNIFDLVDYVLHKNVTQALELYHDLLLNKEEPIKINSILLTQFRLLMQVKILTKKGLTQGDLTQVLKVHPYRIKLALQTARHFSMKDLKRAFLGLEENDYKMKSAQIDKQLLFELFMLKFADPVKQ
ncbi:DNA polymerase III subunit delta [Lactobacillus sp. CC-MHH1034]|nr:DNA polymerase III subunit delta [Agrilactobacillus fermenti]